MRLSLFSLVLVGLGCLCSLAQDALDTSIVIEGGPHHRVWERTTRSVDENGIAHEEAGSYVEVGTGLNIFDINQQRWVPADPSFEIVNGKGVARKTQHKLVVGGAANDPEGLVELFTPEGTKMTLRCIGLALTDPDTGKSVFIAEVNGAAGLLVESNVVVYPNAFDSIGAHIRVQSRLNGIEHDVIINERIGRDLVAAFGINPDTAYIEVWHQVLDNPNPGKSFRRITRSSGRIDIDEILEMPAMSMVEGTAFTINKPEGSPALEAEFGVAKEWLTADGLDFLIEKVPFAEVEAHLADLPPPNQARLEERLKLKDDLVATTGAKRSRPVTLAAAASPVKNLQLASASITPGRIAAQQGFVFDYVTLNTTQCRLNVGAKPSSHDQWQRQFADGAQPV